MLRRTLTLAFLLLALIVGLQVCGCSSDRQATDPPVTGPGEPVVPQPWDLGTPESAVRSYLDWVSFAYRMVNSDIPTATMTPYEYVRVDAYIELNRQDGRAIEQALNSFEVRSVSIEGTSAVVVASEDWDYRYFSIDRLRYIEDLQHASYETTYALVRESVGWLVDSVEAQEASPAQ